MLFRTSTVLLTLCLLYAGCGSAMRGEAITVCGHESYYTYMIGEVVSMGYKELLEYYNTKKPYTSLAAYVPLRDKPGYYSKFSQPYYVKAIYDRSSDLEQGVVIFNDKGKLVDVALRTPIRDGKNYLSFDFSPCTRGNFGTHMMLKPTIKYSYGGQRIAKLNLV